jgi:hypothetical protein
MTATQSRVYHIISYLPMMRDDVALAYETSLSLSLPTTEFDSYRSAETPTPADSALEKLLSGSCGLCL